MPKWLGSRDPLETPKNEECSERIDADGKMNAEKMNAENGTREDAENGNARKKNTKKDHEDAGNRNVAEKMNGRHDKHDERVRNARRRIGRWQGDAHERNRKHAGGSHRMGDVGRTTAEQDARVRRVAVPAVGARVERENAQRGVYGGRAVLGEVGLMARRRRWRVRSFLASRSATMLARRIEE